jgi:hypothetical protein
VSKQHKQKLISLIQQGFKSKDIDIINQALELDDALGKILSLKDFETACRAYIVKKTLDRWKEELSWFLRELSEDATGEQASAMKQYQKNGLGEELEISKWLCWDAKQFDKRNKDWMPIIDSADDYRWYLQNELEF